MKLRVDSESDALYLRLDDSEIIGTAEVSPGVMLDFNAEDQVVGIELLFLSQRASELDLNNLEFESN